MATKTVEAEARLDQFLAEGFSISRSQAKLQIKAGNVKVNGEVTTKASRKLKIGEQVEMNLANEIASTPSPSPNPPSERTLVQAGNPHEILYEDEICLVINKPAGVIVEDLNLGHLVHRLDKGTTGCLLIAKSPESCEALQKQFQDRTVKKQYLAIVAGVPKERKATIEADIGRSLIDRTKMSLFHTAKSRYSKTTYEVLSKTNDAALLLCDIETGRTHQIRVHLSSIGHPILGDDKYASRESKALSKNHKVSSPLLHSWKLSFKSSEDVQCEAPIPLSFKNPNLPNTPN